MKPHRVRMTHNLLLSYGLLNRMDILATPRATPREMTRFHSDEYIKFLSSVAPEVTSNHTTSLCRFNVLEDCPVFDGLWEYCQIAAGGSLAGATRLNDGDSNAAINWAGGLHHAKKAEASGFCYINDCVLAILELLKVHARVLYVDIDIHHGDGVEEAFYTTDRVMTASFHKFGDYFPGTGDVTDVGVSRGKHYAANFPLRDGINDDSYREIFVPVMTRIMEWYRPGAVVLQCGADSLSGDRLGCFNLSLLGHAQCVDFFKRYDTPLLLLGGGGYTIRNVARCWAYETSRLVGETLSDEIPFNENYEFYGPEFRLHIIPSNMENHNSQAELQQTKMKIFENLRHLPHAPSAPIIDTPRVSPIYVPRLESNTNTATIAADDDELDPDVRKRSRRHKVFVDYPGSDDEFDDQYISSLRHARRKYKRITFTHTHNPSAILSPDAEKIPSAYGRDDAEEWTPVRAEDESLIRPGKNHATWTPAKVAPSVEINPFTQDLKSRRVDKINGAMEDSRQTVSGMSNFKDVELKFGQSRRRDRPQQDSIRSFKDGDRARDAHVDSRSRFVEHRPSQMVDEKTTDNMDTSGIRKWPKSDCKMHSQGRRVKNVASNGGIDGDQRYNKIQSFEKRKGSDGENIYNHTEFSDQGRGRSRQYSADLKGALGRMQKGRNKLPKEQSSWKKESWSGNDEIQVVTRPTETADSRVKKHEGTGDKETGKDGNITTQVATVKEETKRPLDVANLISRDSDGANEDENSAREVAGDSQSEMDDREGIEGVSNGQDRNEVDSSGDGDDAKEAAGDENLGVAVEEDDGEEADVEEIYMKRLRRRRGVGNSATAPQGESGAEDDFDDGGRSRDAMSSANDIGEKNDVDANMKAGSRDDNCQRSEDRRSRRGFGNVRGTKSRNNDDNDGGISDSMDNKNPQSSDRWKRWGGRRRSAIVDDVSGSEQEGVRVGDGDDGDSDTENKMNDDDGWRGKEHGGRSSHDSDDGDMDGRPTYRSRSGANTAV